MAKAPQFKYVTLDGVKVRLAGKVQFQAGPEPEPSEISNELLYQCIRDAESDVEVELSARYFIPFMGAGGAPFAALQETTVHQIRRTVEARAVVIILGTDFGRSGHTDGSEYADSQDDIYNKSIERLLGRERVGQTDQKDRPRMTPPLPGLRLALTNVADKGTFGKVINTDASNRDAASYAEQQINDPSLTYIPKSKTGNFL